MQRNKCGGRRIAMRSNQRPSAASTPAESSCSPMSGVQIVTSSISYSGISQLLVGWQKLFFREIGKVLAGYRDEHLGSLASGAPCPHAGTTSGNATAVGIVVGSNDQLEPSDRRKALDRALAAEHPDRRMPEHEQPKAVL